MKSKLKMLGLFLKRYKTRSIFMRDFFMVFIIVLIPVMAVGMAFYNNTKEVTNKEIISINEANLKSCARVIDSLLEEINGVSANLSLNSDLRIYISGDRDTANILGVEENVNEYITDILVTREYIDSIYVYSSKHNLVLHNGINIPFDEFSENGWYESYKVNNDIHAQTIVLRLKNNKYPWFISIIKPIYKNIYSEKEGAVICNINLENLCRMMQTDDGMFNGFIIADENNNVVYSLDNSLVNKQITVEPFKISANITTGSKVGDGDIFVSTMERENNGNWKYMLKFSTQDYKQKISDMLYMSRTLLIFCFIISLVIAMFMTLKSFDFVSKVVDVIQRYVGNGSKDSFNETDYIISNIVSAMSMNEQLQNELLVQINRMRDMQTAALQTQISPHFMRNTLSSISFKAFELYGGENRVSDLLEDFSNLMDCYVKSGDYIVSLKTELENIKLYVNLMNLRYGDRLDVKYDIPEELENFGIIKISLQPIVENSVMHGFKASRSRGNILISVRAEDDNLILSVDDDGCGMSDEEIQKLNSRLADTDSSSRVGINNVNKRYKIALGDEYGITVSHSYMGGICTKITLPRMDIIN